MADHPDPHADARPHHADADHADLPPALADPRAGRAGHAIAANGHVPGAHVDTDQPACARDAGAHGYLTGLPDAVTYHRGSDVIAGAPLADSRHAELRTIAYYVHVADPGADAIDGGAGRRRKSDGDPR